MKMAIGNLAMLISTAALVCTAMTLAWLHFERQRFALLWSLASAGTVLQWLIDGIGEGVVPGARAPVILTSALIIVDSTLVALGGRYRAGLKPHLGLFIAAAAAAIAMVVVFLGVYPHVGLRMFVIDGYAAVMLGFTAFSILPRGRRASLPEIAVFGAFAWFALFEITLVVLTPGVGADAELPGAATFRTVLVTMMPGSYAALAIAAVFLLANDLAEKSQSLITRDALTGSLNRRGLEQASISVLADARRHGRALTVVRADIDHFKRINDGFGHAVGDRTLVAFADLVNAAVREEDIFGRVGGDEFCLILIGMKADEAYALIERTRHEVGQMAIDGTPAGALTASFGIAGLGRDDTSLGDIMRRADAALFTSKVDGRNRVTLVGEAI